MRSERLRLGLLFGGIDLSVPDMARAAREAEAAGMDGLYCVEAYRSGLLPIAAMAAATERVTVGPYVLNSYCRTPFAAGLAALDLDEIAMGRLELAVGSGNAHITRHWLGLEPVPPLAKMRDYVAILRLMLRAGHGEAVRHQGRVHSIDWVQQGIGAKGRPVPVYLAAIFPNMLKLAAAQADGIALGALTCPAYIRDVIRPSVQAATRAAGREPGELGIKVCTMIAVDEDRHAARDYARRAVAGVFAAHPHPYYEHMLREQGFSRQLNRCLAALASGDFEAAANTIDEEVIDATVIWGTPEDCAARLAAYEGLVDEAVLTNVRSSGDDADPVAAYRPLFDLVRRIRPPGSPS